MANVLVLRTCNADMTSRDGFKWPESGPASAPDWNPEPVCGFGLHGFLWGEGDGDLAHWSPDARWLVVEVEESAIVSLGQKVKFPAGCVVHCGDRLSATNYIRANGAAGKAVVGAVVSVGDGGTATVGDGGTATAGDGGTATAGNYGTATAGDGGTAAAGDCGTATAGDCGAARAGVRGTLIFKTWDGDRYRLAVGYVGENGIEPNKPYRVVGGKLTEIKP